MDGINAVAASPFVALVVTLIVCVFLYRLYVEEKRDHRSDNDKHWGIIGTLTDGLRESNTLLSRTLDVVETPRPRRGR